MDDKSKRHIRAVAKRLHWLMQFILFVFVVLGFMIGTQKVPFTDDELHQVVSVKQLSNGSLALTQALFVDESWRLANLFGFRPPANASDDSVWAAQIEDQLKQPVGVFLRRGNEVEWLRLPEHLKPAVALAESLAMGTLTDTIVAYPKTIGSVTTYLASHDRGDSTYLSVRAYDPPDGAPRWGIVLDYLDRWRTLVDALNAYRDHLTYENRVSWLAMLFQFEEPEQWELGTRRLGLRIYDNDSLMYSSPGLDTTHQSYSFDAAGPFRDVIYLSDEEQRWADIFSRTWRESKTGQLAPLDWYGLTYWIVFSFVLALFYRWILKLTRPETDS